ncbi:MAG: DUF6328 family protein [Syntrophomonadaceae bacterium]
MSARPKEKNAGAADRRGTTRVEGLELAKAADQLLEECRMVLPGIQALFGFQLIAVFSQGFAGLEEGLKVLHLAATVLTAIAIALVMTPAAYHRQVSPMAVSEDFVKRSSRLLLACMFPLAASLCVELYLVARVVIDRSWVIAIALAAFALFLALWVFLPARHRRTRSLAR